MNLDPNSNCFPNSIHHDFQIQTHRQHLDHHQGFTPPSSLEVPAPSMAASNSCTSLLYCVSLLKDRVSQVQNLLAALTERDLTPSHEPAAPPSLAAATMGSLIQEISGIATSMTFYCQQLNHLSQACTGTGASSPTATNNNHGHCIDGNGPNNWDGQHGLCDDTVNNLYVANFSIDASAGKSRAVLKTSNPDRVNKSQPRVGLSHLGHAAEASNEVEGKNIGGFEIIELDAADLLAKYTHFCQICGKGFKRDANLRMHMRAHGDEYKSSAALSKPTEVLDVNAMFGTTSSSIERKKYSCPQEGCRWNKNHPKFQPLKSMICAKNHYKRSHCPKMYICKRCSGKHFSVLSDLRTHEKHCGESKWKCSCGTTFSRKDKLMSHVKLFVGHAPVVSDSGIRRTVPAMRIGEAYDGYEYNMARAYPSFLIKPN
ncbi:hypothetical protein MLD38_008277 [Melastoma candidum]|uniref:Uncharacterized protein n=1 Tax=Melastoma candidum TaxID=119954 RepID=A0ACB9S2B9_9MYRT|nr:hypothetical protein MLD38_008277 [Melastoma candidum]